MQKKHYFLAGIAIFTLGILFSFGLKDKQSLEGGDHRLTPVSSFSHAHGIAVDIVDPTKVYIATHEGLYLLSQDKDLYRIGNSKDDLMGFSVHPTLATAFYSSGHPARGGNIGFQKTTDGGISWTKVSDGIGGPVDFHAMAVSSVNPDIIYGFYDGKLQRSVDGGRTWEYGKGTIAPLSLTTDVKDERIIYAATRNGVQVSKDKGDTWESLSPQLEGGAVSIFALDPHTMSPISFSEKLGGMGRSADGGITWQKVSESFNNEVMLYVAFSKSQAGVVYALTNKNSLYKSTDSGVSWGKVL